MSNWKPIQSRDIRLQRRLPLKIDVIQYLRSCDREEIFELFAEAGGYSNVGPAGEDQAGPIKSWDEYAGGNIQIWLRGHNGKKIPAIKLVRRWTDWGLKEAKDAVEAAGPGNRILIKEAWVSPDLLRDLKAELDEGSVKYEVEYL